MFRVVDRNEIFAMVMCLCIVVVLLMPMFYSIPTLVRLITAFNAVYIVYQTLGMSWITAEQPDLSFSFKPEASAAAQLKGIFPICGKNQRGHQTLTVGYRKPTQLDLRLKGIDSLMLGDGSVDDIHVSVTICKRRTKQFGRPFIFGILATVDLDRSLRVLKLEPGYLRWVRHPFEPSKMLVIS